MRLIIIGPMASGKSVVGRKLSKRMGLDFFDTDDCIEKKAGAEISWIFDVEGEQKFRDREFEVLTSLIKKEQKKILVGAIPRSGKTYIMAGTILKDVKDSGNADKKSKTKFNNYLIITPAPNETLKQYYDTFNDYYDFKSSRIY